MIFRVLFLVLFYSGKAPLADGLFFLNTEGFGG